MVTEDFVSFEIAKLLKEKGFDGECFAAYNGNGKLYESDKEVDDNTPYWSDAPTLQMAMKWLREVHNIHIELNPICTGDSNEDLEWHYGWAVRTTIFTDRWKRHDAVNISCEEAVEAAIKYCLENLI